MTLAKIKLWGNTIGAVSWDEDLGLANFEYDPTFLDSGIELSPLTMPLSDQIYSFPALPFKTFRGLPGLLSDSLPDDFGNALIDAWLAKEGREPQSFNPVKRLCYTGDRGMGALEYHPSSGPDSATAEVINIEMLVDLASEILTKREGFQGSFLPLKREESLQNLLEVGTSAGGARAKAIIAWNRKTNEMRSGQIKNGAGFTDWIIKFDGVSGNKDKELNDPAGYGLIEYAYYKMALGAGIDMEECRLLEENNRSHFMTRRFDRTYDSKKIHMQSFAAIRHFDYRKAGAYSYEQALRTIRKLDIGMDAVEEQFRRMAFNVIARNQDDHVKNIAFLMNRSGKWSLSPAFDMTYNYNSDGLWTNSHQMTLNGKRDNFDIEDFKACAKNVSMKQGRAKEILKQVQGAVMKWKGFAEKAGVPEGTARRIRKAQRTDIVK